MLFYPVLSFDDLFISHVLFEDGLLLGDVTMRWFRAHNFDPLSQKSVDMVPGVSIFAATSDILADEAQAFTDVHQQATLDWFSGAPHDALLYNNATGQVALARIAQHLKKYHTPLKGITT